MRRWRACGRRCGSADLWIEVPQGWDRRGEELSEQAEFRGVVGGGEAGAEFHQYDGNRLFLQDFAKSDRLLDMR